MEGASTALYRILHKQVDAPECRFPDDFSAQVCPVAHNALLARQFSAWEIAAPVMLAVWLGRLAGMARM
jgi:hypothetical protein